MEGRAAPIASTPRPAESGRAGGIGPRSGATAAAAVVQAAGRRAEPGAVHPGKLGVVLGTGLGALADRLERAWTLAARDTGWLVPPTATGHVGRVVCGQLRVGGTAREVVMLQGRVHGYEGHPPERLSRGVELLAALGATTVLLTNAAGGVRPDLRSGELVVFSDHVDLVRRPWAEGLGASPPAPAGRGVAPPCYDAELRSRALEAAGRAGTAARAGVYACVSGPSYETRAEYRMLRRIGADVVGMSTVPEAVVARRLGLRVAAVSVVTNVANPDAPAPTDAEDVCRAAAAAGTGVWAIIEGLAPAAEREEKQA
jgi:purine-nucleoside phosphorylase